MRVSAGWGPSVVMACVVCGCLDTSLPAPSNTKPGVIRATVQTIPSGREEPVPAVGATATLLDTPLTAKADADGRLILDGVTRSGGRLLLEFDADTDGVVDHSRVISLENALTGFGRDVNLGLIVLGRSSTVVGTVLLDDRRGSRAGHAGSDVVISGLAPVARTGDDGSFVLRAVPEGALTIEGRHEGYDSATEIVTVGSGEEVRVATIVLTPTPVASGGGVAGGASGGTSGGMSGGTAGGTSGGTAGGMSGGVAGGTSGGSSGGMGGGAAGGSSGGVAGGTSGGSSGGTSGGSPDAGVDLPPTATLMTSVNTLVLPGMVTFTVTTSDDVGISRVELFDGLVLVSTTTMAASPNRYVFNRTFSAADNRTHAFIARAYDTAQQVGSSIAIPVNVTIPVPSSPVDLGFEPGCRSIVMQDGSVLISSGATTGPGVCTSLTLPNFRLSVGLSNVIAASSSNGSGLQLFLRDDGRVACDDNSTRCGANWVQPPNVSFVTGLTDAVQVGASQNGAQCAVSNNSTASCWAGAYPGSPGAASSATPRVVVFADGGSFTGVVKTVGCNYGNFFLRSDGTLYAIGRNDGSGFLGVGFTRPTGGENQPTSVVQAAGASPITNVVDVACGLNFVVVATSDAGVLGFGRVSAAGELGNPALAIGTYHAAVPAAAGLGGVVDLECGTDFTVALDSNGQVWTWGVNTSGQLGNGTLLNSDVPVLVQGLPPIRRVGAGGQSAMALATDGRLFAWGDSNTTGIADAGLRILTPRPVDLP